MRVFIMFMLVISNFTIGVEKKSFYDFDSDYIVDEENKTIYDYFEDFQSEENSTFSIPDINIEDPGTGSGSSNLSFETAYSLTLNSSRTAQISAGTKKYYKFTNDKLRYISIYSTSSCDSIVKIYDSNFSEIDYGFCDGHDNASEINDVIYDNQKLNNILIYNKNHAQNVIGVSNMDNNFFVNFYAEPSEIYYFEIDVANNNSGSVNFEFIEDNWNSINNYSSVTISDNAIVNQKIIINSESCYSQQIGYAVNEWNKFDAIDFEFNSNNYSVKIIDVENEYFLGKTIFDENSAIIKLNTSELSTLTNDEIIKTIMHELGHTIGMNEFNDDANFVEYANIQNIMHQGAIPLTKFGPADIAVYNYMFE